MDRPLVLDLGAGAVASLDRPLARGARHLRLDLTSDLIGPHPGLALVGDGRALPLRADSVDHVVLRNVLGDVGLGLEFEDATGGLAPAVYAERVRELAARHDLTGLEELRAKVRSAAARSTTTRLEILAETARVLRRDGTVLVVETMTPAYARKFLGDLCQRQRTGELELVAGSARFLCVEVRSHNRRRRYCTSEELLDRGLSVWLLSAARCEPPSVASGPATP